MNPVTIFLVLALIFSAEGRPQPQMEEVKELLKDTGSAVKENVNKIGGAVRDLAKGAVEGVREVGGEVGGLVDDVVDVGVNTASSVNGAVGAIAKEGMGGVRKIVGATADYAKENVRDVGEFATAAVKGNLGTAVSAIELTGDYASNIAGATVGLIQRVLGAGGKLVIEVVGNTVDLARGAGNVVEDVAGKAVTVVTGYEGGET